MPLLGLAPMDGITDQPFRQIVAKYAKPDLIYTEFTHTAGLCHQAEPVFRQLIFSPLQQPVIAQLYGKTPEYFYQAAILICQLGFSGIDLNMGCPSRSVAGGGAGAGLIAQPGLARKLIEATAQGVQAWLAGQNWPEPLPKFLQAQDQSQLPASQRRPLPISVKTRLGIERFSPKTWFEPLLEADFTTLTVHGRTLKQGYSGQADWAAIQQVVALANQRKKVLGNGDVQSYAEAVAKIKQYQVDGVLIGRAARGNPFVFKAKDPLANLDQAARAKQVALLALEHAQLYEQTFQDLPSYHFLPMRKHLAWYIKGFPQASTWRARLVRASSAREVEEILQGLVGE